MPKTTLARQLFEEALKRPEAQRAAFLAAACNNDTELLCEVNRLLDSNRLLDANLQAKSFVAEDTHPSLKIGRYVVTKELGRGGMGIVYEATDPQIGRRVAIKIIHVQSFTSPEEAAILQERLFREARSAGALSHPGIVVIYDVGEDGQLAYIAMERVDGPSLHDVLTSGHRFVPAAGLDLVRQMASALDYAHQNGVVHRDVKPANILLHQQTRVKIVDFGIARIGPKHTVTGTVMGTPEYMSPEQIEAQSIDGRSDQFSLAVVTYELLTGATPFHGGSSASIMYRIVGGPRPSARAANPLLPAGVDEVLQRAMSKLRDQRYATCAEFVQALEGCFQGAILPVTAAPPRKKFRLVAAAAFALIAVLGAAIHYVPDLGRSRASARQVAVFASGARQDPHSQPPGLRAPDAATASRPSIIPAQVGDTSQYATKAALLVAKPVPVDPVPVDRLPVDRRVPEIAPATAPKSRQGGGVPVVSAPAAPLPAAHGTLGPSDGRPPLAGASPLTGANVRHLRNAVTPGDIAAVDKAGQMYERDNGISQNPTDAFRLQGKAGPADRAAALYRRGILYETGNGLAKNLNEAIRLYQQAAAGGNADAQARLTQPPAAAVRPAPKTSAIGVGFPRRAVTVNVPANAAWTDTGINLRAGDNIAAAASGLIAIESDGRIPPKAPGGFAPDCAAASAIYGGALGNFPVPRLPCWSLIGRVGGNGIVFEIGVKRAFRTRSDGRLFLGINDDNFANNSGYWTVVLAFQGSQ